MLVQSSKRILIIFFVIFQVFISYQALARENIEHMIGLYIPQRSLNFFEHNIDQVLEINGYSTSSYYHHHYEKKFERKKSIFPKILGIKIFKSNFCVESVDGIRYMI